MVSGNDWLTEREMRSIIEANTVSIWIVDEDDRIRYVNPAGLALTGYSAEALIGQSFSMLMEDSMADRHAMKIKAYARTGGPSNILGQVREFQIRVQSGELIDIELKAFELQGTNHDKKLFAGLISDIRDRKSLESRLRQRATHDPLTGALNRSGFFRIAKRELDRGGPDRHPMGLLLLDVDHFKYINDRFGHQAGDRVLQALVAELRRGLREEDLLGRYGGEEFIVLLPEVDVEHFEHIAERLRHGIESMRLPGDDGDVSLTISLGGALRRSGEDIDRMIGRADKSLYRAKQAGRNRVVIEFEPPAG
jgi:diguanylate cyclase (GGDEF)-like protein/PAS domain S-box-containing protein